jgi:hypothetical protein
VDVRRMQEGAFKKSFWQGARVPSMGKPILEGEV